MAVHDLQQTVVPRSPDDLLAALSDRRDIAWQCTLDQIPIKIPVDDFRPVIQPCSTHIQHTCCTSLRIDFFANDRLRRAVVQPLCRNSRASLLKRLYRISVFSPVSSIILSVSYQTMRNDQITSFDRRCLCELLSTQRSAVESVSELKSFWCYYIFGML